MKQLLGRMSARRSPHGERGLKLSGEFRADPRLDGRSPHGERGLKCGGAVDRNQGWKSLPSRGAWIEMLVYCCIDVYLSSLPSRGAWIEISQLSSTKGTVVCRSPHGERGLKFVSDS